MFRNVIIDGAIEANQPVAEKTLQQEVADEQATWVDGHPVPSSRQLADPSNLPVSPIPGYSFYIRDGQPQLETDPDGKLVPTPVRTDGLGNPLPARPGDDFIGLYTYSRPNDEPEISGAITYSAPNPIVSQQPSFDGWSLLANFGLGSLHGLQGLNHARLAAASYFADQALAFKQRGIQSTDVGNAFSAAKQFASDESMRLSDGGVNNTKTAQLVNSQILEGGLYQHAIDVTSDRIGSTVGYFENSSPNKIAYDLGNAAAGTLPVVLLTDGVGTLFDVSGEGLMAGRELISGGSTDAGIASESGLAEEAETTYAKIDRAVAQDSGQAEAISAVRAPEASLQQLSKMLRL